MEQTELFPVVERTVQHVCGHSERRRASNEEELDYLAKLAARQPCLDCLATFLTRRSEAAESPQPRAEESPAREVIRADIPLEEESQGIKVQDPPGHTWLSNGMDVG
jgi:hypothetical protein